MLRHLSLLLLGCLLSTHLLAAEPAPAEETPAEPEAVLQGGLLGALADGLDSAAKDMDLDAHLVDAWRLRTDRASKEVQRLVDRHSGSDTLALAGDFLLLTMAWVTSFAVLTLLGRLLFRRMARSRLLIRRNRVRSVVGLLLPYTLPALAALPLTLYASRFLEPSVARALGLSLSYATSSGLFSTSIILCLITLFDAGHKRAAVAAIRRLAPRPLFMIGFLAAWSDALTSAQIARQLGGNITSSIAVITGLLATLVFASLVIRLRRPVAHLIRNRSLKDRLQHRAL
ncbi:MAG TPA: mechanosensitive ion channel protein, partial [Pseudomonas sp.]|nr:mechanosensitive ion channel protein [Pseudomonas sp.]